MTKIYHKTYKFAKYFKCVYQLFVSTCLFVFVSLVFVGCSSFGQKDYIPENKPISKKLPNLECLLEINSVEYAVLKKTESLPGSMCGTSQEFNYYLFDDIANIFANNISYNICDSSSIKKGKIVCKVLERENNNGLSPWFLFSILGTPFEYSETFIKLQVEILDLENNRIKTYHGKGESTKYTGMYYGIYVDKYDRVRKSNVEAVKNALIEINEAISNDALNIEIDLNNSYSKLLIDRENSREQTQMSSEQLQQGNVYFQNNEFENAVLMYDSVLTEYPNHTLVILNKGKALFKLEKNNAALNCFKRVIELEPDNPNAYFESGVVNYSLNNIYTAIYHYNTAINYSPKMTEAFLLRGFAEEDLELNKMAIEDFKKVLELDPDMNIAQEKISSIQEKIKKKNELEKEEAKKQRELAMQQLQQSLLNLSNQLSTNKDNLNSPNSNNTQSNQDMEIDCNKNKKVYINYLKSLKDAIISYLKTKESSTNAVLVVSKLKIVQNYQSILRNLRYRALKQNCNIEENELETWR